MSDNLSLPGFADQVADAQSCFRAVLTAMSRPGKLCQAGAALRPPAPLDPATAAVLLTLVDGEAPLFIDPAAEAARDWLAFHCGAQFATREQASFALAMTLPDLSALSAGTHEAPETSTTLVLQVAALGSGTRYRLAGPGLREPTPFAATGLPPTFVQIWQANHALYPRGVDLVLCAGKTLTALPRSVSIEEA
jgi:alpha-D-ribose 1-methylphosphonate 5-triphosphate synthase subunit PhnH